MKIVFLCAGYESLGLEYLSACLKKTGHQAQLLYDPVLFDSFVFTNAKLSKWFSYKEKIIAKLVNLKPDLIGFSVVTATYLWATELALEIKKRINVPIVFGGIHATLVPEILIKNDFIDYVCVGEGEESIVELVSVLENNRSCVVDGIVTKKKSVQTNKLRLYSGALDELPLLDKELFYAEYAGFKRVYSIMAGRGCCYQCTFCHHSYLKKKTAGKSAYLRKRSVSNVINELAQAKERYRIKKVCFFDDLFSSDLDWLQEFSEQYRTQVDLPFVCAVHPSQVDREVVLSLEKAGCVAVGLGIQTSSEALRRNILKRYESNIQIEKAINCFKSSKVLLYTDVIVGLPQQGEAELIATAIFINRVRPDMALPMWLKYYPRIDITKIGQDVGILDAQDIEDIEFGLRSSFKGSTFSKKLGRLMTFMLLSPILPIVFHRFVVKYKLYNYLFSSSAFIYVRLLLGFVSFYRRVICGKRKYIFSCFDQILYMSYFIGRIFFMKKGNKL